MRELEDTLKEVRSQVLKDIAFVTEKMTVIRKKVDNIENLDIKDMADFYRYSETRLFLVKTLISLKGDV